MRAARCRQHLQSLSVLSRDRRSSLAPPAIPRVRAYGLSRTPMKADPSIPRPSPAANELPSRDVAALVNAMNQPGRIGSQSRSDRTNGLVRQSENRLTRRMACRYPHEEFDATAGGRAERGERVRSTAATSKVFELSTLIEGPDFTECPRRHDGKLWFTERGRRRSSSPALSIAR